MTAPSRQPTPPVTPDAPADGDYDDGRREHMTNPAQSPHRSPNDQLPPSAATPDAPGRPGLAGEFQSDPITHRRTPVEQHPEPSNRWFPPVSD
jgi:hypothetical protein